MICKECPNLEKRFTKKTKGCYCTHPDKAYINDWLIKHDNFYTTAGFICYAKPDGEVRTKTSPR